MTQRKGTILIVDDEPNVLWFISKTFQPLGYETLTCSSGLEALKFVQEFGNKIDLVLLDLRMPGMGGIEVLKSVRRFQPDLPVIIMTALHDKRDECEELGVEAFIKKPYSLEDLYERIEKVIDRQTLDKEEIVIEEGMQPSAKILVVDADPEVCEILSGTLAEDLQDCKFTVEFALNGDDALIKADQFKPDIGIIDIRIPDMSGDELIEKFKKRNGHCPSDFVIYTDATEPEDVEKVHKLGHKMLTKPSNLDALVEILKRICVRHKLLTKK